MTINAILSNAFSGLSATQAALRVTSNNVANVNTEGYARQEAKVSSNVVGGLGAGVSIEQITRVVDSFLEAAEGSAISGAEAATVVRSYHDQVQAVLGRPDSDTSLTARLDNAMQGLNTVTLDTTDPLRRQALIADLAAFTDELAKLSRDVQDLRVDASNQMVAQVEAANAALENIARLNPKITSARLGQSETGPLEDQRDRAIRELASIMDIRAVPMSSGAVQITTSNGVTLLDDTRRQLSYSSPGAGDSSTVFGQISVQRRDPVTDAVLPGNTVLDPSIQSGRLKGLMNVRDAELPAIAEGLGELARVFADALNEVHNESTTAPAPNALTGRATGLLVSDLAHMTGEADFSVVDDEGVLIAKAAIDFTALGPTATMANVIAAINTGLGGAATAALGSDGTLTLTATNPAHGVAIAGDELAPAQRGGRGFAHYFGMNDLISTSVPTHHQTGFTATDAHGFGVGEAISFEVRNQDNRTLRSMTFTVSGTTINDVLTDLNDPAGLGGYYSFTLSASGEIEATAQAGYGDLKLLTLADDTQRGGTGISLTDLFGLKQGAQAAVAADIAVSPHVARNQANLSLAKFDRAAVVGERAIAKGDGRGAAALRDLQLDTVDTNATDTLQGMNTTLSQYTAFVIGNAAVMAQTASSAEEDTRNLQITVSQQRQDVSGVNIDEELGQMVIFQNAYNASARLVRAAQDLYDQLLQVV